VSEFLQQPYCFFTEADAVARFHQILEANPLFGQKTKTLDGVLTPLVHQEYPTFFRFDDKNPIARLDSGASRGHYDIVILNSEFVRTHAAETVKNRNIASLRDETILPFKAVVEFKLDDRGWSNGKKKGAIAELGKLILSREEVELRYFVVLMRYMASTENRWNKYWPEIMQAAENLEIKSVFATHRISTKERPHVRSFGDWLSKYEEQHQYG
jgi:hypothetical protein